MDRFRTLSAIALLSTASVVVAQQAPTPPDAPSGPKKIVRMERHEGPGMERGGNHGGPGMGMWWKNDATVKAIGLAPDQQKKIEEIFMQSRVQLIHLHAQLEEQELMMEPLMGANPIDQGKAMSQIDRIANTRADLEKANAKMLLGIRGVLSADQWTKLQAQHRGHRGGSEGRGGPGGGMQHGPRGGGDQGPRGPQGMPGPGAE